MLEKVKQKKRVQFFITAHKGNLNNSGILSREETSLTILTILTQSYNDCINFIALLEKRPDVTQCSVTCKLHGLLLHPSLAAMCHVEGGKVMSVILQVPN